jgi:hypothetical protein
VRQVERKQEMRLDVIVEVLVRQQLDKRFSFRRFPESSGPRPELVRPSAFYANHVGSTMHAFDLVADSEDRG